MALKGANFASPRNEGAAVVASDSVNIACGPDGALIYIGGTGDVSVVLAPPGGGNVDGPVLTYKAYPAGQWLPVMVRRVNNTLTTATNMIANW